MDMSSEVKKPVPASTNWISTIVAVVGTASVFFFCPTALRQSVETLAITSHTDDERVLWLMGLMLFSISAIVVYISFQGSNVARSVFVVVLGTQTIITFLMNAYYWKGIDAMHHEGVRVARWIIVPFVVTALFEYIIRRRVGKRWDTTLLVVWFGCTVAILTQTSPNFLKLAGHIVYPEGLQAALYVNIVIVSCCVGYANWRNVKGPHSAVPTESAVL